MVIKVAFKTSLETNSSTMRRWDATLSTLTFIVDDISVLRVNIK
jgi:hypothetical protein